MIPETLPVLFDYPQLGKIIYNPNGTPFIGGGKFYRIQFAYALPTAQSIIAAADNNGEILTGGYQLCAGNF